MTLADHLESLVPPGEIRRFGELSVSRGEEGGFLIRHREDETAQELISLSDPAAVREWAKFDAAGEYRPLRTAPGLKTGFEIRCRGTEETLRFLDAIYPGAFATTVAYSAGELDPVPLRETLDRQTGMYRFAGAITDQMANRIMRDLCSPGCLRRIAWPIDDRCATGRIPPSKKSIPLLCTEACTFAVSEARRLAKEAYDRENAPT